MLFVLLFYHRNKSSRKIKAFQKLSDKESDFICQSISTIYNKTFKFISRTNFLEEHHIPSPEIWGKSFTDWFRKSFHGGIFSILAIIQHIMGNATNFVCPRCKKFFHFKGNLAFRFNKLRFTLLNWDQKETFWRPGTPF